MGIHNRWRRDAFFPLQPATKAFIGFILPDTFRMYDTIALVFIQMHVECFRFPCFFRMQFYNLSMQDEHRFRLEIRILLYRL